MYNAIVRFFFEIDHFAWCFSTSFTRPNPSLITGHVLLSYHVSYEHKYRLRAPLKQTITHIVNSSKLWQRVIYFEFIELWICQSKTTIYNHFIWLAALLYFVCAHTHTHISYCWFDGDGCMTACCYKSLMTDQSLNPFFIVLDLSDVENIKPSKITFGKIRNEVMNIVPHQYHQPILNASITLVLMKSSH